MKSNTSSEQIRSHFGALEIKGIKVEIMGDLQKRLANQKWEEPVRIESYRHWIEIDEVRIPVKILPFQPENQETVRGLILEGLEERWGYLDESKNPDLEDVGVSYGEATFLVAWLDGEIVGTGAFIPRSERVVEIVRMSVLRELRRQGIGWRILRELCRRAYESAYREAISETTNTWEGVIEFYRQFGFQITRYVEDDVYFGLDLHEFFVQLSESPETWVRRS
ncbi:GNAT family N-acetyltransferase [Dehalococcoidia bacterium]|nr:GNAT family N-acetyltransferase [Dehalococcoidia bacterium]MCL0089828.1 GNAT family N-acetyltransferase [Dehalococcoidia bacterium]MCL0093460.1 GNAT family N-acetyltransferase [Dehalococcoidia bacterium]